MDTVFFAPLASTPKAPIYPSSFNTLSMASFSFEAPTPTVGLPADCALRMRVRRSAIGSVMLIVRASPAGLGQTRNLAAIGGLAQLGARQSELAVNTARPAGNGASIALARRGRIARLLLQLDLRGGALFRPGLRFADQLFELGASGSVFLGYLEAALLAHEHVRLGHGLLPYLRNGKLKASSSARPCLSSAADVEMVMSMPRI